MCHTDLRPNSEKPLELASSNESESKSMTLVLSNHCRLPSTSLGSLLTPVDSWQILINYLDFIKHHGEPSKLCLDLLVQ